MKNDLEKQPGKFSNDPEENLHIENEILHLKLRAELGGELIGNQSLPPKLENTFLKNILEFEHAYANAVQVKIFDFLGKPSFKRATDLTDDEIEVAFEYVCALMETKNIVLDFSGDYDTRLKYCFIVDELFEKETDNINIPGLITHYWYEEFHPNHKLDIESRSKEFIEHWFNQDVDENNLELADDFILANGKILKKEEVIANIKTVFASYQKFNNGNYCIKDIKFELHQDNEGLKGMGCAEGNVSYEAFLENGEMLRMEGPFKFLLSMDYEWWNIFYFVFPGFQGEHWQ